MNALQTVLNDVGQAPINLDDRILVLPFGGRVIGLFPCPELNALWVNPALGDAGRAREFLADPGWINLGGDRTWISPEVDTHVRNPGAMMDGYAVPKAVDPAAYEVVAHDRSSVTLASRMAAPFRRSGEVVELTVSRTIERLDAPPFDLPEGTEFAGYRQEAVLTVANPGKARPGLWSILQVPGGGRIEMPVRAGARPRAFIGTPVYELQGERLRCRVDTEASFKFSLVAGDSRGCMCYLNDSGPREILLVRRFPVLEAQRYADVSCTAPDDLGRKLTLAPLEIDLDHPADRCVDTVFEDGLQRALGAQHKLTGPTVAVGDHEERPVRRALDPVHAQADAFRPGPGSVDAGALQGVVEQTSQSLVAHKRAATEIGAGVDHGALPDLGTHNQGQLGRARTQDFAFRARQPGVVAGAVQQASLSHPDGEHLTPLHTARRKCLHHVRRQVLAVVARGQGDAQMHRRRKQGFPNAECIGESAAG